MAYDLSDAAFEDYLSIYAQGVARFGLSQAELYSDSLEQTFELIALQPGLARIRTELSPPVRVHPHQAHLIIYREHDNGVTILRIRHGRENWADRPL